MNVFEDTWFDDLQSEGYITDVIRPLKSGKEASVHLCRGAPSTGEALLAAKVYRPRAARSFKNDAAYTAGRVITNARTRRAVQGKTRFGREVEERMWVGREYETLREVHTAGAEVPRPVACSDTAILMEYVGDEDEAAPQLKDVRLSEREAAHVFERLLQNVEVFLSRNLVHADLSPFNVLWWNGEIRIIDFPQAVDARTNPNARDLLWRDIEHVCRFAARFGVDRDPAKLASGLWDRFLLARL